MEPTPRGDVQTSRPDCHPRLRINVLDALMAAKGVRTVKAQAKLFGLDRTHWFDIRAGRKVPRLDTAMRIACTAGAAVEELWARL